jgi:hypothetical protein
MKVKLTNTTTEGGKNIVRSQKATPRKLHSVAQNKSLKESEKDFLRVEIFVYLLVLIPEFITCVVGCRLC